MTCWYWLTWWFDLLTIIRQKKHRGRTWLIIRAQTFQIFWGSIHTLTQHSKTSAVTYRRQLADKENAFVAFTEYQRQRKLQITKLLIKFAFDHVFDSALHENDFGRQNKQQNILIQSGTVQSYEDLETALPKLRKKNNHMKTEWRRIKVYIWSRR